MSSSYFLPSLSATDLKMITGGILCNEPLAAPVAFRSAAACCEEAIVNCLLEAMLISLFVRCRASGLAGCRVTKHVRVLGLISCCILRSNVVNCSRVDLCSIDLSPLLTSHLYRLIHVCLKCFCYYI